MSQLVRRLYIGSQMALGNAEFEVYTNKKRPYAFKFSHLHMDDPTRATSVRRLLESTQCLTDVVISSCFGRNVDDMIDFAMDRTPETLEYSSSWDWDHSVLSALGRGLQQNRRLRSLSLKFLQNRLDHGNHWETFVQGLKLNTSLKEISIVANFSSPQLLEDFSVAILTEPESRNNETASDSNLEKITFGLGAADLDGLGNSLVPLTSRLRTNSLLKDIFLTDCNLDHHDMGNLAELCCYSKVIKKISIQSCTISSFPSVIEFAGRLPMMETLEHLLIQPKLSQFDEPVCQAFLDGLLDNDTCRGNRSLTRLSVTTHNDILQSETDFYIELNRRGTRSFLDKGKWFQALCDAKESSQSIEMNVSVAYHVLRHCPHQWSNATPKDVVERSFKRLRRSRRLIVKSYD